MTSDTSTSEFFVAGGTLHRGAPSYVKRPADEELYNVTLAGEFSYVLTPRQMGKSSLMIRTATRLKEQGISTAIIDLTEIGTNVTIEQWYSSFLIQLQRKLKLSADTLTWWQAHATITCTQRFVDFVRDVVLKETSGRVVVFIDEIDTTLKYDFRDDFFGAIRRMYNARAEEPEFKRLTFVLLGVASPADLVKDRARTPFNIGQGIILDDFSRTTLSVLREGLETVYPMQGKEILDRIFYWTNGHPYLTQKLCLEIVKAKYTRLNEEIIDIQVQELFRSDRARKETNLRFAQDMILSHPQQRKLLALYRKILEGERIRVDDESVLQSQLKLSGLIKGENGYLRVRNRIYETVFDFDRIGSSTSRGPVESPSITRSNSVELTSTKSFSSVEFPSSNRVSLVILLLMSLGVPIAAGVAFAEEIRQTPIAWLMLAIFYEIVVIILGFVGKVWQKLESKWVDRVADWIDFRLLSNFSGYKKRYLAHSIYQHRSFDVKGLSTQGIYTLELEQVFVELSLVPGPAHQTSADPFQQVPEELREGQHLIWDYLKAKKMANQHLVVIGAPGSGKTTLLKHLTLTLAIGKKTRQGSRIPRKLPILLFLRNLPESIEHNPYLSLPEAVKNDLDRTGGPPAPSGWFENQLAVGQCLVMLDGLDEVIDPQARNAVADWVERQMMAYGKSRFIVTSRPFGYQSNPLTGVTVFEVCPFTRAQVTRFVQNWYLANELMSVQKDDPGVRLAAQQGAEDLLHRINHNAALSTLAVNPLLLTMIALVHRYRSSLPGRSVELYAEICEVFLGKRQQARGLELAMTPTQKQRVLQPLAYVMMCRQVREIPVAEAAAIIQKSSPQIVGVDFLKAVEQTSGLLLERENGVYSFAHLSFQEYLASVHIRDQRLERELQQRVGNSWWHGTIRLYAAQADATPILEACLADDKPTVPALTLAIECRAEARNLSPEVRQRLDRLLAVGIEDTDPERRRIIAEALLTQRLHGLIRIDEDKYVDPTLVTHAEYQLFLDETRPDHLSEHRVSPGQGRTPISDVSLSDGAAFCKWLTKRESTDWTYRLPLLEELNTFKLSGVNEDVLTKDGSIALGGILLVRELRRW